MFPQPWNFLISFRKKLSLVIIPLLQDSSRCRDYLSLCLFALTVGPQRTRTVFFWEVPPTLAQCLAQIWVNEYVNVSVKTTSSFIASIYLSIHPSIHPSICSISHYQVVSVFPTLYPPSTGTLQESFLGAVPRVTSQPISCLPPMPPHPFLNTSLGCFSLLLSSCISFHLDFPV